MGRQVQALEQMVTITAATQAERFDAFLTLREQAGVPMRFQDAVGLLAKRHVPLSRSAWHKLRDPKYLIKNFNVLAGFADIFGADGEYLIKEDAATPQAIEAQRDSLASARTASVLEFATKRMSVEQFSPEDTKLLHDLLMKYAAPTN